MKKLKYLGTSALVLALVMSSLSGCGEKKLTLEDILAKVKENTEASSGMTGVMEMVMEANITDPSLGMDMDMGISMTVDMKTSKQEAKEISSVSGTIEISALGQEMSMEMESYTLQEGGTVKSYSCTDGEWEYSEDDAEGMGEMASEMASLYENAENWTLAEEKEDKNGVSCYVLTGAVSGEDLDAYSEMTESLSGEEADLSQVEMPMTLYVDAEKLLPVSILVDGAEAMTQMLAGTADEGSEFETFTIAINNITYGDVEITIPEEALAAEEAGAVEPELEEETGSEALPAESEAAGEESEVAAPAGDVLATVVDDENVTIQITGVDATDDYEYLVNLYFENKTDKNLTFSAYSGSVNGLTVDMYGGEDLAAGKRANTSASVTWDELQNAGILEVTDLGIQFMVYNADDYAEDYLVNQYVHCYPQGEAAATAYERTAAATDQVLVDNDYVTVTVTGFGHDDIWGHTMELYLVNKMDSITMFSLDNVSVNGFMIDPYWADEVLPGCSAYSTVSWYDEDFDTNGVTEIEEVEFTLTCYDSYDWDVPDYMEETFTVTP